MRIAHVSLSMEYYPGIARMRGEESLAAAGVRGVDWDVWVASPDDRYERDNVRFHRLPSPKREGGDPSSGRLRFFLDRALSLNQSAARIRFVRFLNRLADDYDLLLVRYNPADILSWAWLRHREKILFLHHSKAVEELAGQSMLGAWVERMTGPLQSGGCRAVCGVTPEIAGHEASRMGGGRQALVFPNGVYAARRIPLADEREGALKMVMVSSDFRFWQGLDTVLDRLEDEGNLGCELHLAGRMNEVLERRARSLDGVHVHGLLDDGGVEGLLARADAGLSSMAVYRKGLAQASPLKTRSCLLRGVPVAGVFEDPSFPEAFPHYLELGRDWRWEEIVRFARESREMPRDTVFEEARPYIDYQAIIEHFAREAASL